MWLLKVCVRSGLCKSVSGKMVANVRLCLVRLGKWGLWHVWEHGVCGTSGGMGLWHVCVWEKMIPVAI